MVQEKPATAYLAMASMFSKAVWALLRDPPEPGVVLPALFMVHHAIELYLKAYLSLKRKVEHIHDMACTRFG